jgi:hypothetical protein
MNRQRGIDCPTLMWDADNKAFSNLPEANQFLHYPYREGWTL